MPDLDTTSHLAAFERLYSEHERAVLAFCLRRISIPADAEEAAASTFTVAWRRMADAPSEELRRAWLYAIARRVLANARRGSDRRSRLLDRLRARPVAPATSAAQYGVTDALDRLRPDDQELLRLVAWEGLSHLEIAQVLEVSVNAVTIRLHRARGRLRDELLKGSESSRTSGEVKGRMFGRPRREESE